MGEASLGDLFPRLFRLSLDKDSKVSDNGEWRNGSWEWNWRWRRNLFDRKKVLFDNLSDLINRYQLQQFVEDYWQ